MSDCFPFIVGNARSGTTLLRAMLDSHPDLAIPWESYFITRLRPGRTRYERPEGFAIDLFVNDLMQTPFAFWSIDQGEIRDVLLEQDAGDYPGAVRAIFSLHARREGKTRWGDKTPEYVLEVDWLARLLPESSFVHIVRDGRDVALSLKEVSWGPKTFEKSVLGWQTAVNTARDAGRRLGEARYLEIRYEELVGRPEQTLRLVCQFLHLDFDPGMLRYYERASAVLRDEPSKEYHQNLFRAPTPELRNWRTAMSRSDQDEFERLAGHSLAAFGYELGGPCS